jgi:hypothetical protein
MLSVATSQEEISPEGKVLSRTGESVMLGGKEYTLSPKRGRARTRKFREYLGPLIEDITGLGSLLEKHFSEGENELDSTDWNALVPLVKKLIGKDFDELLDLVYEWEPSIAKDKNFLEGIETEAGEEIPDEHQGESGATDVEFIKALFVILKFIYGPFVSELMGIEVVKNQMMTQLSKTLQQE